MNTNQNLQKSANVVWFHFPVEMFKSLNYKYFLKNHKGFYLQLTVIVEYRHVVFGNRLLLSV